MRRYLFIAKALSDATRVRLLCALRGGELCVCQLIELVRLAPSTVSKHLSILYQAGLVESHKQGRWVYYSIPAEPAGHFLRVVLESTFKELEEDPIIIGDKDRLEEIKSIDVEELCQRTSEKD